MIATTASALPSLSRAGPTGLTTTARRLPARGATGGAASLRFPVKAKAQPEQQQSHPAPERRVVQTATLATGRREAFGAAALVAAAATLSAQPQEAQAARDDDPDFTRTASGLKMGRVASTRGRNAGLRVFDAKLGTGATPAKGDKVVVHWSGYTSGYQGKRIENTSVRDEPFAFTIGANEVIPAFEEAVLGMSVGGLRRIEIPGEKPELSYPRDRKERFTDAVNTKYRFGPQPSELGGQRALDFVLDNPTLQPFNRTLVYDIRLLTIRGKK